MNGEENKIREQINVAAFYLSQKNYAYDNLCWMLAERQLIIQKDPRFNQKERIREKAASIFFKSYPYDVLCWLIAELDILLEIKKPKKPKYRII